MDFEDRLWATMYCLGFVLALAIVAAFHYNCSVMPLRMAEQGYCEVQVPAAGGGFRTAWQPCPPTHPKLEK